MTINTNKQILFKIQYEDKISYGLSRRIKIILFQNSCVQYDSGYKFVPHMR